MAQATTLNDAQIKRALRFCQSRKHVTRDTTILQFSLYTGLRAKELAALRIGDVYDTEGAVRTQFTLSKSQTKAVVLALCSSTSSSLSSSQCIASGDTAVIRMRHCSAVKKGDTSQPTQCASCSSTYSTHVDCKVQAVTVEDAHSSHAWPTRVLVCVCLQHWLGTQVLPSHNSTLTLTMNS